ncbi:MAG: glycolate oxidase subunit GlcE [Gammaproteobacteria bacterium]|nr:glycolate oxidase subunit GlcE [Gammaproteobacteria bacterium]
MTLVESFQDTLRAAAATGTPVSIRAGGSKSFYGRPGTGTGFSVAEYTGIIDYSPTELVISARAGTPLAELEAALAKENQMLPFEPPHFGPGATLGGTIACGFSGPRRPYAGAARDHVLGITCLNGRGERLRFGGQVMKNVAGYDISRTLTGSLGTLAVLLDITLKVLPRPETELTLSLEASPEQALEWLNVWAGQPLPLSGGGCIGKQLMVRLSGFEQGVKAAAQRLGGDELAAADSFWQDLREQRHPFFQDDRPLWRLSVPPATAAFALEADELIDWGGAQRWLKTSLPAQILRDTAARAGGHATRFRGGNRDDVFHPLDPALLALHQRLKASFDPAGILNPGRMYSGI